MYRVNPNDPHNYDLVLDSHSLGLPIAAEIIIRAIEVGKEAPAAVKPIKKDLTPMDEGLAS